MRISRASQLKQFFLRNGYYRVPDETVRERLKSSYKKGYEIRFAAMNYKEFLKIRKLLKALDFEAGKTFWKGNRRIIPVYGKENYTEFKELMKKTKVNSQS